METTIDEWQPGEGAMDDPTRPRPRMRVIAFALSIGFSLLLWLGLAMLGFHHDRQPPANAGGTSRSAGANTSGSPAPISRLPLH